MNFLTHARACSLNLRNSAQVPQTVYDLPNGAGRSLCRSLFFVRFGIHAAKGPNIDSVGTCKGGTTFDQRAVRQPARIWVPTGLFPFSGYPWAGICSWDSPYEDGLVMGYLLSLATLLDETRIRGCGGHCAQALYYILYTCHNRASTYG